MLTPKKIAHTHEILDLPKRKISDLYAFVRSDLRNLEIIQIPAIQVNYLENDWNKLCSELEHQIYCLCIKASHQFANEQYVFFDLKSFEGFLKERSQRTAIGLSLLSHCCRISNWKYFSECISQIDHLKILENIDQHWNDLIEQSRALLLDHRVVDLLSTISELKPSHSRQIISKNQFQLNLIDAPADIKGWVTPFGIAINIRELYGPEKVNIFAFSRLIGHELTHFMSLLSSNNFSFSTPEKARSESSSSLNLLISDLKKIHPDIENHLESGLLFELGFIGRKFSFTHERASRLLCEELEISFSNPSHKLPLYTTNDDKKFEILALNYNEQFGLSIRQILTL
jgi:hypothetical protein